MIGGTGFYAFLHEPRSTPSRLRTATRPRRSRWGTSPADGWRSCPATAPDHDFPPHAINYRANLWALRSLGVRQVLAPCAVGGLRDEVAPGDVVVPDQLVDRTRRRGRPTWRRARSTSRSPIPTAHASPEPSPPPTALKVGGTMVVIEGPRFSTRAESSELRRRGLDPGQHDRDPEAALARELRMCYASIALVTDMDAGAETGEGVGRRRSSRSSRQNLERLRLSSTDTSRGCPSPDGCACATWADDLVLTYEVP